MIDGRWNRTQFYISSHPKVFCKKDVLRNSAKFTEKHLCQSLFFNKVAGLRPPTLLKKRLQHRCFPVNFVNFLRKPFYIEHLWQLLLILSESIIFSFAWFGKPSCKDLILKKLCKSLVNSQNGLSDFHKLASFLRHINKRYLLSRKYTIKFFDIF